LPIIEDQGEFLDVSPNQELEDNKETIIKEVDDFSDRRVMVMAKVSGVAQNIFIGMLAMMVLSLLVNIVVRVQVQHRGVIVQTLFVIVFISGLIYYKFNYLESGISKIFIG